MVDCAVDEQIEHCPGDALATAVGADGVVEGVVAVSVVVGSWDT